MRTSLLLLLVTGLTSAQSPPQAPAALRPPAEQRLTFQVHGVGVQIYGCTGNDGQFTWVLQGPDAELFNSEGKVVGKHFAGPTWQASDGSRVVGKAAATTDSPAAGAVPWLLLRTIKQEGSGVLSGVLSIQRLNTKGGKAPAGGCTSSRANQSVRVPYEADYYFYSASRPG